MSKTQDESSFFEKLATFIVDKRSLIFFLYTIAIAFSIVSMSWVKVCNNLTDYLSPDTETRKGLTIMEDEFVTYGTARIMVSNVSYEIAKNLAEQIEEIKGVSSAAFGVSDSAETDDNEDAKPETPEDIAKYMKGSDALINVTFDGEEDDPVSVDAMNAIRELLAHYDSYISSEVGVSSAETLASEMSVILVIVAIIIVIVLLLTSRSYAELPIMLITFIAAAVLNMGTNYWFRKISFISNSVTVVLQLALAIDYAIILLHRFTEEREHFDPRQACINALSYSIPAIAASSLTTISGLGAMLFMQFRIGADMAMVLIKAICFSMLSVFTLMPGLLMLFSQALVKTKHKEFLPKIDRWGNLVVKLRYLGTPLFVLCLAGGFFLSGACPYVYGYSQIETSRQNQTQLAEKKINETFGSQNIVALLVPRGDYDKEKKLLERLESYDQVDFATGLSNIEAMDGYTLTDNLTPRQFAEMTDVDYETICLLYSAYASNQKEYGKIVGGIGDYTVPLMDMFLFLYNQKEEGYITLDEETEQEINDLYQQLVDGRTQMLSKHYSRMILNLNLPEEGQETFNFLKTIHQEAGRYYDKSQVYVVGNSTSDYDLSTCFVHDNVMISVLSAVFVILILLFTFQSVGLPVLLIMVIQGSIWINFSFPTIVRTPIFFMSYLIVTAIQMGANIDYAIVISTRYDEMKTTLPPRQAIVKALDLAFPTVFTSGSILSSAAFLIAKISTEPTIVGIGECLCRGTLISMFLVMFVLPQLLLLGDILVKYTRFSIRVPARTKRISGTVFVDGHVRGRISGVVNATMRGFVRGDISAMVDNGTLQETPEEAKSHYHEEDT